MAREIPYIQALGEAVHQEMARDESVLYFGQNLGLTDDDPYVQAFGNDRVRVTPISETAEIGMAVGAAFAGFRPVVREGLTPALGQVLVVDVRLSLSRSETLSVLQYEARDGNQGASVSARVGTRAIQGLPANGRDFVSFTLLTPGVVSERTRT